MLLAVNAAAATPPLVVVTVIVAVPLENVPLAPLLGARNVTCTPVNWLPPESVTVTCNAAPNAVPIKVLCGVVPAVAAMFAAGPALLVSWKLAGPMVPAMTVTL
jgi:hypothetical protein